MSRHGRSLSLSAPKYLPYEAQHVLLNTVQRLLEESCFEFAKAWFAPDHRVREWTTPSQVEISKWRDLLGNARIPQEALDGSIKTPLRVLLQEATYVRNNAVHRSQVLVDDIFKLLDSSIQLTRMLRDEKRCKKIESIRGHLNREVTARGDNNDRATAQYRKTRDDIDRRKEPLFRSLDKLRDEEDHAATVFDKDSASHDNMLQSSMIKFVNQVIHTGEEIARITRTADSSQKAPPIVKNSSTVMDAKSGRDQEKDDDDVQFISKSDFEVATLGSRKLEKRPTQDTRPEFKDQAVLVKQDHTEDMLPITQTTAKFVIAQSTPGSRHRLRSDTAAEGTPRSGSCGGTPRALNIVRSQQGIDPKYTDSPSRQLVLEANMANNIRELSIDAGDILGHLDAELDRQLLRRVPSSELKVIERSSAPSPDVEMSGTDAASVRTISTTAAESVTGSVTESAFSNLLKEDISRATVSAPAIEFGKAWKPTAHGPVSSIKPDKPQGMPPQTIVGSPVAELDKSSVSIVEREESKNVNLSNMHSGRKRKAVSPLGQRDPASCNSMMPTRPVAFSMKPNLSLGVVRNTTGIQATTSVSGLPVMASFGDVSQLAKDAGFNPQDAASFKGVGMGTSQMNKPGDTMKFDLAPVAFFAAEGVPQEAQDVYKSRQVATWERRRIVVGCLSFTPSKAEVEKLFSGYNVTRINFPELWIMGNESRPAGCVFVDLATATQVKLFIQKSNAGDTKIRNCKVSIMLATEPWRGPNAPRKVLSASTKNKKKKNNAQSSDVAYLSRRKTQPIGKRTRSWYAKMRNNVPDDQSPKKQKVTTENAKDTPPVAVN
ncbi:hypothetical protein V494_08279 [Pseudogymnoascus sp. VKM F-4513 (FW-928)]|nr:hypothetical protein V494_08279 [Pseudogymnoascus sp. VKM F-4513 (FW-928)]